MATTTLEVSGIEHRWAAFKEVPDLIDEKFEDGRGYAQDALRQASETISELKEVAEQLNEIDIDLVIDDLVIPDFGTFASTAPVAPTIDINFPEPPSDTDDINSAVHDILLEKLVNEAPAIDEATEDIIFKRESERALLLHNESVDRISEEWAKRGFTLPNAFLTAAINEEEINYINKRLDVSRDIAIKNFELTDTNRKFAIQQGLVYVAHRIEIYKARIQAEVARIEALVKKYLGQVEVYKGEAQVYMTLAEVTMKKFDAELKKVTVRAELLIKNAEIDIKNFEIVNSLKIEAMKAIGSINAQVVAGALASVHAAVYLSASNAGNYNYSTNPSY